MLSYHVAVRTSPERAASVTNSSTADDFRFFRFFFPPFFLYPIYYLCPSILSILVVTQIRGHIAGSSPPLPTAVRALHFYREKLSALSCLVDSRRIVLPYTRHSPQLILLYLGK